jgi:HK97 family phage major capsid protein
MAREYGDAFRSWMRTGDPSELRAMGVSTGSAGGYLFPPAFYADIAVQLKEYLALARDFTQVETDHGRPVSAPTASVAAAGTILTENTAPVGNDRTFGQVVLNSYAFSSGIALLSRQLEQDSAFAPEEYLGAFVAEAIGRALSPFTVAGTGSSQPQGAIVVANTQGSAGTVGGAITAQGGYVSLAAAAPVTVNGTASTELAKNVLSPATIQAMIQAVDPAYYGDAKWWFNPVQFAAQAAVTDSQGLPLIRPNGPRELYGWPIEIANEIPNLVASTRGGPVFGSLSKGMYLRTAGLELTLYRERWADSAQVGYNAYLRADTRGRDARAFVTVGVAAT